MKVAFRKLDGEDGVIALFPDLKEGEGLISSYAKNGQHCPADEGPVDALEVATEIEFADLMKELKSIGYDNIKADWALDIVQLEKEMSEMIEFLENKKDSIRDYCNAEHREYINSSIASRISDRIDLLIGDSLDIINTLKKRESAED